jgi:hypothetical protein
MTLSVPITVRIDDRHITPQVAAVKYKINAVGGVESISLRLARQLDQLPTDLALLTRVYVYDARSAKTLAEGRITDTGRSADATSGQQWDITAFGPAQHAYDETKPYILVDTRQDTFVRYFGSTKNATTQTDERSEDEPSLVIAAEEGKSITTSWLGDFINRSFLQAGMKIARVRCDLDSGITNANYNIRLITRNGTAGATVVDSATANTAGTTLAATIVGTIPADHDVAEVSVVRTTSTITAAETHWFETYNWSISAVRKAATGADITSGTYAQNYVFAHEVVNDLLGRSLPQFDGTNASVSTGGTYQIDQLAYPDGVTPGQVLEDLMVLEPGYRWTTGPTTSSGGGYAFKWVAWDGSPRYEITLNDGGSFPVSASDLYNEVTVRWQARNGRTRSTTVTGECPILTTAGVTRRAMIDLADEIGSSANATQAGTNFLLDHKYPANTGQLRVNRPILDLNTDSMISPQEIEPGNLIRVKGLESYPDALNASDNDGLTIFRIWTMEYDSDTDAATLELDTYSRTVANQVAGLIRKRTRKR